LQVSRSAFLKKYPQDSGKNDEFWGSLTYYMPLFSVSIEHLEKTVAGVKDRISLWLLSEAGS
jgi:hypothetical protein